MNNNLSLELRLLVLSIKVSLSGEEKTLFKETLLSSLLDWGRVHALVDYHQIIPIFYNACKEVSFQNKYVDQYEIFSKRQAITNLLYEQEYLKIEQILSQNQIRVIPYKGVLFLKELYIEKPLRQMSDLDILVHERDAVQALQLLLKDGYKIKETAETHPESLNRLISDIPNKEISLHKSYLGGTTIWLDFHWHILGSSKYNVNVDQLLNLTLKKSWGSKTIKTPSKEAIFIMLLVHHGGRDCWARLKYICDLRMFLNICSNDDFTLLANVSGSTRLSKVFNIGLQLECIEFGGIMKYSKTAIDKDSINDIIKMWEVGKFWDSIVPKIRMLNIYKKLQEKDVSWKLILREQVDFHSQKRETAYNFSNNYLRALFQLMQYIWRRINHIK